MKHFNATLEGQVKDANAVSGGWQLTGPKPGPTLVIVGSGAALAGAVKRLQALPSLAYLRGHLRVCSTIPDIAIDTLVSIKTEVEQDAYWHILAAAARLGMISGRGIPARFLRVQG